MHGNETWIERLSPAEVVEGCSDSELRLQQGCDTWGSLYAGAADTMHLQT